MSDKQINNHTPLPWNLRKKPGLPSFIEAPRHNGMAYGLDICGDDYTGYGDNEQREQNMEFIHHACSIHYRLVSALKELRDYVKLVNDHSDEGGIELHDSVYLADEVIQRAEKIVPPIQPTGDTNEED